MYKGRVRVADPDTELVDPDIFFTFISIQNYNIIENPVGNSYFTVFKSHLLVLNNCLINS